MCTKACRKKLSGVCVTISESPKQCLQNHLHSLIHTCTYGKGSVSRSQEFAVQEGAACVNTIITTAGRYKKSSCFNGDPPYVRVYAKGRLQLLLMNTIELKSPCFKLTHKRERILNGSCTCIYEFSSLLSAFASKASFFTMKRSWSAVPIKSLSSLAMM